MSATPTDVLIVGGGGAGCSTALHLANRGVRCILLERGQIGGQASGVNYGGVRQQGRHPAELPLARRSREIWAKLPELIGTDCEFEVTGHLKLARNEAEEADLIAYLDVAKANGLPLIMIGGNAIHQHYPWLGPDVVAGSLAPDDGAANPRLLSPALARAARDRGADIREFMPVNNLTHDGTQFIVRSGENEFRAQYIVNTAGYWGGAIAKAFGEPVPVSPLSPNMLVTEPLSYFITPNLGVVGGDVYLRQIRRGNIIFGGGRGESDPDVPRSRPLPEPGYAVMAKALQLVPQLAGVQVIRSWTGIDGETPDDIPVIGPSRTTPGLFHAFGFSGHGFQLGPVIGAIMSELILDGRTDVPLEPFRIDRFAQDGLFNQQGQTHEAFRHA
ncbi:FAD-binding oxidoreductase [Bradyrhizobium sp. SSUT18]|uniref:NAD(P)/FAD-dependent oxidoreductase n=1 Tax=unclassified Bradyrhizobium TaxID=2631580 RepID=UPI002448D5B6|nr:MULTISPECIES: FAD-binding oxidoreductase [unclassified Bradyrhizobium]MDH2341874.1 FAD-binding oxidoreductase [Bradyrhizobium sp. SSUT77]MDH2354463.1 FAD-binding oxidoreductase [Bradyrhizobium sp. SSUT112]MDH2398671.1 FAD-binding oxidoreductase [Bradyrhizobium sp. SSUT18]